MPAEWCKCGKKLVGERRQRIEFCKYCEKLEEKEIADVTEFVNNLPILEEKDGLTYVIDQQPEFDD